jgi:hypothetical protein
LDPWELRGRWTEKEIRTALVWVNERGRDRYSMQIACEIARIRMMLAGKKIKLETGYFDLPFSAVAQTVAVREREQFEIDRDDELKQWRNAYHANPSKVWADYQRGMLLKNLQAPAGQRSRPPQPLQEAQSPPARNPIEPSPPNPTLLAEALKHQLMPAQERLPSE